MAGKLIVLEGLDGSGKATQAEMLYSRLISAGIKAKKISFPDYDSESSALIKMYLRGDFGKSPSDVDPCAASLFYTVDRFASYKMKWGEFYNNGGIVIADRYTTSNAVHQCCKLPDTLWDEYLNWLFPLEYNILGLPVPHKVFFLNVEPEVSKKLIEKRYSGDESKKDIHESLEYLSKSYESAKYCCEKLNWIEIKCSENGEMRDIKSINDDILTQII